MTNGELVTRFIRYYGGEITEGRVGNDITPVAPYILMDVAYQSYCKHIAHLPVRGRVKQLRNRWTDAYNRYNRQLFLPFKEAEYGEITDKMDEVEEFIGDEVRCLETAIVAHLRGRIESGEETIASILLTNILAQAAQELTRIASKSLTGQESESPELNSIRVFCLKFGSAYLPPERNVNTSDDPIVCDAVRALSLKIAKWIFEQ